MAMYWNLGDNPGNERWHALSAGGAMETHGIKNQFKKKKEKKIEKWNRSMKYSE